MRSDENTPENHHPIFTEQNEPILYTVPIYALGDSIWSALSYLNFGINLKPTNDINFDTRSQWAGQQLYSTLGMGVLGMVIAARYGLKKEYAKAADVMTIAAAGSLSLYTWDRAQTCGIAFFTDKGYSMNAAGYLSSIFTGLAEAITQLIFIKVVKLLSNNEEYTAFKQNPQNYFLRLLGETGLNLTIGAIPGAIWQLVYNAAAIGTIGAAATGLSVAVSVALSNIAAMKSMQLIMQSDTYSNCFGKIPREPADESETAPCIQCLSWMRNEPKSPTADEEAQTPASLLPQMM